MSRPTTRDLKAPRLRPRIKVWLESEGQYAFGFGLAEILQAVARTGSIKHAAADLGKSYRYVWGRVKAAERVLGQRLVETQVGGTGTQRSSLTGPARTLVDGFLALRRDLSRAVEQEFLQKFGE
jgi:molybdate transport system regulatory protein